MYFLVEIFTVETALYKYNGSAMLKILDNVGGLSLMNVNQTVVLPSSSNAHTSIAKYIIAIACTATVVLIAVTIALVFVKKQRNKHKYMLLSTNDTESASNRFS